MRQGEVDTSRASAPTGAWRLADLFGLSVETPELLEQLRAIQWSARQVIGSNLGGHSLDQHTLERLQASVLRQAQQAKELERRFAQVGADTALQDEIIDLRRFLDEALAEIEQQLGARH